MRQLKHLCFRIMCYVFIADSSFLSAYTPIKNFLFDVELSSGSSRELDGDLQKYGIYKLVYPKMNNTLLYFNLNTYRYNSCDGIDIGSGLRAQSSPNAIIGMNLYYEQQNNHKKWKQFSIGFELLTKSMTFYGNAYLPIGSKSIITEQMVFDDYDGPYFVICTSKEIVASGLELNASKQLFANHAVSLYLNLCGYGFSFHRCDRIAGLGASMNINLYKKMFITPKITYDHVYGTNASISLRFYFPIGNTRDKLKLIESPVRRKPYIRTKSCCTYESNY